MTDMNGNTQEEPPVIYNISKHKDEENLESSKRRKTSHTGIPTQDFSLETSEARRQWVDTSKVLKEKKTVNQESCIWENCPSKMREELRYSLINKSLEFITTGSALQEILKEVLQVEMREQYLKHMKK